MDIYENLINQIDNIINGNQNTFVFYKASKILFYEKDKHIMSVSVSLKKEKEKIGNLNYNNKNHKYKIISIIKNFKMSKMEFEKFVGIGVIKKDPLASKNLFIILDDNEINFKMSSEFLPKKNAIKITFDNASIFFTNMTHRYKNEILKDGRRIKFTEEREEA